MTGLGAPQHSIKCTVSLSGSKSISNRLLLLNEIIKTPLELGNLSDAEDTNLLKQAIAIIKAKTGTVIDVGHAGTDFRFLTAFLSITPGVWTLTGSERMKQRPVGSLVNALRNLGANISYIGQENYPPLNITGSDLTGGTLAIDAGISSQFVSALLLIAPALPGGLELRLQGQVVSAPYIRMSVELLKALGAKVVFSQNGIHVSPLTTDPSITAFEIESDWSSASYWYSMCALSAGSEVELPRLFKQSLQADAVLPGLFEGLGVETRFSENSIVLRNVKTKLTFFEHDFSDCPDLAQTLAVTCFGLGIECHLQGLKTLKIKETDRILALKAELEKFGANVAITNQSIHIGPARNLKPKTPVAINTYNDHRMAMSFAPLALVFGQLFIQHPEVVDKSYPAFWRDLKSAGFSVNLQP